MLGGNSGQVGRRWKRRVTGSLFSPVPLPGHRDLACFLCRALLPEALPHLRAMDSAAHGLILQNHEPQINFSSFSLFWSGAWVTAMQS